MHRSYELQGSLKRRRKHPHPTSINGYYTVKNGLGAIVYKWPTFTFVHESGYTLAFAQRIAHSGSHAERGGVSDGGGITTLGAFHTFRKPCVARCQNGKLCRFWVLAGCAPEERRKPSEQRCAHARRCSEGVAAPLGRVIFLLLSKLRLVCPVPDTSFGSPDAPACAVPVQAASQLVPFRLGVQWFSVETGRIFCYNFGKRVT